jgi:hypothetical protein
LGGRGRWISEFKASLVYRVSSRAVSDIQRNPVLNPPPPPPPPKKEREQNTHRSKYGDKMYSIESRKGQPEIVTLGDSSHIQLPNLDTTVDTKK